jgi:hypothetical protein
MADRDDTALTVVVAAAASPLAPAVARAYEHLIATGLVATCLWVRVGESGGLEAIALGDADTVAGIPPRQSDPSLLNVVAAADRSRIRVVALALPGDGDTATEGDLPDQVYQAFSNYEGAGMRITYTCLLIPSVDSPAGQPASPSLRTGSVRGVPWENIVVAPEDRADDGAMAVPAACGPKFPFHAAAAIASAAGTWVGMDDDPLDEWRRTAPEAFINSDGKVVVMRSRTRSLIVPSTADAVPGASLARRQQWPIPPNAVAARVPSAAVDTVGRAFIGGAGSPLVYARPPAPPEFTPTPLTIAQLFRMLGRWLTRRLPKLAADEIRRRVMGATDTVEDWLSSKILGDSSVFQLDRRGRLAHERESLDAEEFVKGLERDFGSELTQRTPPVEPQVWRVLRDWSLSLVDGSPSLDAAAIGLTEGGHRVVVNDPGDVAPDPNELGWWEPPAAVASVMGIEGLEIRPCDAWTARRVSEALARLRAERAAAAGGAPASPGSDVAAAASRRAAVLEVPPEEIESAASELAQATEARKASFMWRLATTMTDAMEAASADYAHLLAVLASPPSADFAADIERRRRRARRGLIIRLVLVAIAGWIGFRILTNVNVSEGVGRALVAILALVLVLLVLASIWRFARKRFQLEHERDRAVGEYAHACATIGPVTVELSRLHHVYQQFLDWAEIIGAIVYRPFGKPMAYRGRVHGAWAGGLHAHQVGEGEISADTLTGLISGQANVLYRQGWLTDTYEWLGDRVTGRFRQLTQLDAERADPTMDNSIGRFTDPVQQHAPRLFLRNELVNGDTLQELRRTRMAEILDRLAALPPSKLCDAVDGSAPSAWLVEAVPQATPAPFPLTMWTQDGLMKAPDVTLTRRTLWVPQGLGVPAREDIEIYESRQHDGELASCVVCVDLSVHCSPDLLAVFGESPTAPVDLVPIPPPPGVSEERRLVGFVGAGPDASSLPEIGTMVVPRVAPARPTVAGSYSFMSVVDGVPCRYPLDAPVPYRVRLGVGPEDAYALVGQAFQVVADASGMSFRFDGTFTGLDEIDESSGGIWLAFVEPNEATGVAGTILGHGGVLTLDKAVIGGRVVVGNDEGAEPGFGPGHTIGSVLLHELCHAMNLGHVDVQAELMYPYATSLTPEFFGPGDTMGLWLLGTGRGTGY